MRRCSKSVDVTMAIGSPLIVSIVSLQHIFLLTVHPVGAFVLQHKTAHKLIDRNQTGEYSDQNNRLPRKVILPLDARALLFWSLQGASPFIFCTIFNLETLYPVR
jgi:hypothetical protein